ncbi:arylsulfatase [Mycobacteroides abscessus]|nr:arylsulfatase domain protein [Mycobacteroides abscessus 4S-0726-RA]EIU00051.1 arylsulfatase domain protein [Mycobacteroides abscessus 4S-0303]EIU02546.1 arylsulfatase domain protein [Mycobacteroides abscessus 4S-0726-RB]EIV13819.1 arylsulfatase domain protein [Mycobacteroides abscessus 4S-0206]EIV53015.1 arylsulfatase domain protein [Mycobacteroides abscessus 4S-0116-R]EIV66953.1 arylsulfatase domain protein [Mycobacteroides abscessus 4S-0116-S]PVA36926.1 arylsulfatase [Mycobacteroides abs
MPAVRATLFEDDTLRCRFRGDFGEDRKDWPRISTIAPRPTAALLG